MLCENAAQRLLRKLGSRWATPFVLPQKSEGGTLSRDCARPPVHPLWLQHRDAAVPTAHTQRRTRRLSLCGPLGGSLVLIYVGVFSHQEETKRHLVLSWVLCYEFYLQHHPASRNRPVLPLNIHRAHGNVRPTLRLRPRLLATAIGSLWYATLQLPYEPENSLRKHQTLGKGEDTPKEHSILSLQTKEQPPPTTTHYHPIVVFGVVWFVLFTSLHLWPHIAQGAR